MPAIESIINNSNRFIQFHVQVKETHHNIMKARCIKIKLIFTLGITSVVTTVSSSILVSGKML